jgi:TPR repeat protein
MYFHGQGAPQDYAEAFRWWQKAAGQGYAPAQASLGNMYYYSDGAPQDSAEAVRWYRKAADQGYAIAQYSLGYMYHYGYGVPQDSAEADRWLHKAADQGDEDARRVLRRKMSTLLKIDYSVMSLGSLLLLIGPGLPRWLFRARQQRTASLVGILGLSYVAMSLYGFYHFGICEPGPVADALYFAKSLLGGIIIIVVTSLACPESAKPKSAKIALGTFAALFIGFNLFAIAHHDLACLAPAIRIFCMVNGQLIGISVSLAVYLWRTHKKARGEQNGNSEAAALKSPDASGIEPN